MQLLGKPPQPQCWEQGLGGLAGKSCHAAQTAQGKERDPEVKFTLGQICVLNTS